MNSYLRAIIVVLIFLFLAGCGQSGPLFIPGDPSTVEPQPQQQQQTTEEEEEDDDNGAASP